MAAATAAIIAARSPSGSEVADPEVRIHRLEKQSASDTERGRRRKAGYARRSQFRSKVAEA
jgi:hypothetical protein